MVAAVRARGQMLERAQVALARGDCATATDLALTVLARDGACADAWLVLGDAARRLDQGDAAREAYLRALTLRPQDPARIDTPINLALLQFLQGAHDAALANLTGVLQHEPDHARALLLTARVQQRRGRLAEAEGLCRHLLARHPAWPGTVLVLGRVLHEQGHHDQAAMVLTDLLAAEPGNAEAWHEQGVVLTALGRLAAARAAFDTALRLAQQQHETRGKLGGLSA